MPKIINLTQGSSTQRGALNHQAIEDYLKTIYKLSQIESPVSTNALAEARDVSAPSVTGMIRRLSDLELLHYEKRRGVMLTAEGERIALEVIRHHRLIELYLIQKLGFTKDDVHDEAELLEHVISEKLEDRMAESLGHPDMDPHGSPIPPKEGQDVVEMASRLAGTEVGTAVTISRIPEKFQSYCVERGLEIGTEFTLIDKEPISGTLLVQTADGVKLVNGRIAYHIEI